MKLEDNHLAALGRWRPRESWPFRAYARAVAYSCIVIMRGLNRLEVEGIEEFQHLRHRREKHRGLLTFSNHVSLLDDPLLTGNFQTPDYKELRWIAADALNFYGGPVRAQLSSAGKCVPVVRGGGPDQPGFHFLEERLLAGDWIHIFPEGGRTRDPQGLLRTPFKNGIGRLIARAQPIVVPFYHYGMHQVLPIGSRLPRIGNRVRVRFGKAVDCNAEFFEKLGVNREEGGAQLYRAISQWTCDQLKSLETQINPHANPTTH